MTGGPTIVLRRGPVTCTLVPGLGGAIRSLQIEDRAILRPTHARRPNILDTACFPLVPFANRIGYGRFPYGDDMIVLPADPAAPPHAHHGFGWRHPWTVTRQDSAAVRLRYAHMPDAWPWRFEAVQTIELLDAGCTMTLSVTNLDDTSMPCGLGFHPYFVRDDTSAIVTAATGLLTTGPDGLPTGTTGFAPGRHRLSALAPCDNLFVDDSGTIRIETNGLTIDMAAPAATGFHVYVPDGQDFFCVEPVSHRPDSFQTASAAERIAPGERQMFRTTIVVR